jgi:hypothetical protein
MCSSMRVFCVFIWIAHLGRGTSDPFHERRTAHPDRLGEVVGGGLRCFVSLCLPWLVIHGPDSKRDAWALSAPLGNSPEVSGNF